MTFLPAALQGAHKRYWQEILDDGAFKRSSLPMSMGMEDRNAICMTRLKLAANTAWTRAESSRGREKEKQDNTSCLDSAIVDEQSGEETRCGPASAVACGCRKDIQPYL